MVGAVVAGVLVVVGVVLVVVGVGVVVVVVVVVAPASGVTVIVNCFDPLVHVTVLPTESSVVIVPEHVTVVVVIGYVMPLRWSHVTVTA